MNNLFRFPSGRRFWFNIAAISGMLLLALLAFPIPATLSADDLRGVVTLIPTEVLPSEETANIAGGSFGAEQILLRFQASSLPAQAKVTAAHLSLVASKNTNTGQSVNVYTCSYDATLTPQPATTEGNLFDGETSNTPKEGRANWDAIPPPPTFLAALEAKGSKFSLLLKTTSSAKSSWYLVKSSVSSNRPRLILEYTVTGQPAVTQSDGLPAVQSARPFLPTPMPTPDNGKASGPFSYVTRPFPAAWSYTPVFYKNLVYLMTDVNGKKKLQALNPLGGDPVWTKEISGSPGPTATPSPSASPGQHLLVLQSGRLYIVGDQKILVYQLDPKNAATPATEQPLSPKPVSNLNPTLPPAVGPDGSLYFVNGQEVYGLNPDLQELWKVTLAGTTTSRVTVGPSGRFVYLTAKDEGLIAINAQTGESFTNPLTNQNALKELKEDNKPSLHAPVVILHPDGSEKIYVAANSLNDGVLACFNNLDVATAVSKGDRQKKIVAAKDFPPLKGPWSQPILDQLSPGTVENPSGKQIYAVRVTNNQGTLTGIHWLTGVTKDMTRTFAVGASPYLLNGGNLALDKNRALDKTSNCFVWNGGGEIGEIGLYTFGTDFSGRMDSSASGIPMKAQLFFGSDGTLYASTVDGDRILRAIVPQYKLDANSPVSISSPTNLQVDGTAAVRVDGKTWTLTAPGSVLLGNGFTVKQGATFSVKRP